MLNINRSDIIISKQISTVRFVRNGAKYSRMGQVKFVEESL